MPERTPRDPVLVALGSAAVGAAVTGLVMAYFMRRMMQREDEAARRAWPPWPNEEVRFTSERPGIRVNGKDHPFVSYDMPAVELRRVLAELRGANESFTLRYARLRPPVARGSDTRPPRTTP